MILVQVAVNQRLTKRQNNPSTYRNPCINTLNVCKVRKDLRERSPSGSVRIVVPLQSNLSRKWHGHLSELPYPDEYGITKLRENAPGMSFGHKESRDWTCSKNICLCISSHYSKIMPKCNRKAIRSIGVMQDRMANATIAYRQCDSKRREEMQREFERRKGDSCHSWPL